MASLCAMFYPFCLQVGFLKTEVGEASEMCMFYYDSLDT
jgi:hypothetical protein